MSQTLKVNQTLKRNHHLHEEKVMREGQRRHFEDGVILVDTNVIRVMVHQDCVTFNAMNKDGVEV